MHQGEATRTTPAVIDPRAVFTAAQLRAALGLRKGTVPNAVRAGRLRVARIEGRYVTTGEWVWQWIAGSELTRYRQGTKNGR